jgi:hypothetical protein
VTRVSGGASNISKGGGRTRGPNPAESGAPFILSEALPVVQAKLVRKIQKGDINMAELLKDNMGMGRRQPGESSQGQRLSRREALRVSRAGCTASVCMRRWCVRNTQTRPENWVYQAMMVTEHRKCGWLLYDSALRQQVTSLEDANFANINQSLYSTNFLAYGGRGQFCT